MMRSGRQPIAAGFLAAIAALSPVTLSAAECASPGTSGSGTISGVVNTYWPATGNLAAGGTSISLGAGRGASAGISPGDLVLIIQMQDAQFDNRNDGRYGDGVNGDPDSGVTNLRNSGLYAFARATNTVGLAGGTLNIAAATGIAFSNANAGGSGQRRYQVVRVPQYANATISGTLTAAAWDGTSGGVIAIDVADDLVFSGGTIDASGLGFRGGGGRSLTGGSGANTDRRTASTNNANASKGEGVAGTPRYTLGAGVLTDNVVEGYPNGSYARGAPGNAGGGGTDGNPAANDQNTGGGGGAGAGAGGRGGHAWCATAPTGCPQTGGWGGAGIAQSVNRLIMGGGGGAGTTNNATGSPASGLASSGAPGGGIIHLRAGRISGSGTVRANGAASFSTVGNDSNGGGGAGGAILIATQDASAASLAIEARGGDGGSNTGGGVAHGPGGGGGGGFVATNFSVSPNLSAGSPGTTVNGGTFGANYGATAGASGASATISASSVPGLSSGAECKVGVEKAFSPAVTGSGAPVRLTITLRNPNPTLAMSGLSLTDAYPAGLVNRTPPGVSNSCGGSASATGGGTSISLTGASIAANNSCAIGVDVIGTPPGAIVNVVPAGGATATISGRAVSNLSPTSGTLTISGAMSAGKTAVIVSDPVNGASGPYALPGAIVEYIISFTNPGPADIDASSIVIVDALPSTLSFLNQDISAPGSGPVGFTDSAPASGLSVPPASVSFSNTGGATFGYAPTPGADPAVTHVRVAPTGSMAAGRTVSVRFRAVVK